MENQNPSPLDPQQRRNFLKKSAFAGTALFILTRGSGLGAPPTATSTASPSPSASATNTSIVVTIPSKDLGLDDDGHRQEGQKMEAGAYQWKYSPAAITLPHDPPASENAAPPNYYTIEAHVTPTNLAGAITFDLGGDEPNCIEIVSYAADSATPGLIKIKIRAKTRSTPAPGTWDRRTDGTLLKAHYGGNVVGTGRFCVVVPDSIDAGAAGSPVVAPSNVAIHSITTYAEYEGKPVNGNPLLSQHQSPPATSGWGFICMEFVPVKILDQFKKPLSDIYVGTSVNEDTWIAWMESGQYTDPVGTDLQISQDHKTTTFEPISIKVAGHAVGSISRKIKLDRTDDYHADYTLTW